MLMGLPEATTFNMHGQAVGLQPMPLLQKQDKKRNICQRHLPAGIFYDPPQYSLFFSAIDPVFAGEASRYAITNHSSATDSMVSDEDFWGWIRESYTVSPNIINLNNGGVAPQPKVVQDAHIRYYQYANEAPSYYMWQILDQGREPLREKLAGLAGCDKEEIAINRNATEGLNTVIFGLNLKAGR